MLFNQNKKLFNPNSPTDTPTYIFEGTKEELRRLKEEKIEMGIIATIFYIFLKMVLRFIPKAQIWSLIK
jgi:hypothetical protein